MEFQVWSRDEYGQQSILTMELNMNRPVFQELSKALDAARKQAHNDNMENAMTTAEQTRDWSSYVVDFIDDQGEGVNEAFFCGWGPGGKPMACVKDGDVFIPVRVADTNLAPVFYIGKSPNGSVLHAEDGRKNLITDFSHQDAQHKTAYFVKILSK